MKRRTVLVASALPLLWSCASKPKLPQYVRIDPTNYAKTIQLPPLDTSQIVNIGDSMISTRRIALIPALTLTTPAVLSTTYDKSWRFDITLKQGTYELVATDAVGGRYFQHRERLSTVYAPIAPSKKSQEDGPDYVGGIYLSTEGQRSIYLQESESNTLSALYPAESIQPIQGVVERPAPGETLQKELIYLGRAGSIITVKYREYWLGIARPDFSLEVRYDLSQSKSIGYKSARFSIQDTSNTSLSYTVQDYLN